MNGLLWIAQLLLAGVFLFTGAVKLFAYERLAGTLGARSRGGKIGLPRLVAAVVGLLEIAGAIGVILPEAWTPAAFQPNYLLVRLSAGGLAVLMVMAGIYHLIRREEAAPAVAGFLLALFILVGRWPR
jgi:DoxX-like family